MKLITPLLLTILLVSCYEFRTAQPTVAPPSTQAIIAPTPEPRAAPVTAAPVAPATSAAAVDAALWHLRYAHGLLKTKPAL
jgi:hypothetical protein